MIDLRALLAELINVWINGRKIHDGIPLPLRERIDAALAEPEPEPVTEVLPGEGAPYIPRYSIPVGTKLYAAPPPTSPDDARDAARWRALRNWPFAQTRLVHGTDWPTWGPGSGSSSLGLKSQI